MAGRGGVRASDADRERVIDTLKSAFVQGKLTRDELGARAGQALTSRTYAELAAICAGLVEAAAPPRIPAAAERAWRPVNKKAVALGAAVFLTPALAAAFFATYYGGFIILLVFVFIGAIATAGPSGAVTRRQR